MKKRIFAILILIAITAISLPFSAQASEEPLGTERQSVDFGKTFTITTEDELAHLAELVNSGQTCAGTKFFLTKDIAITKDFDLNGEGNWSPIGTTANGFSGYFDGNGFSVSVNIVNNTNMQAAGLFGYVASDGVIESVSVTGSVKSDFMTYTGGVVGHNMGAVQYCYNIALISGDYYVGGIIGYNKGTVKNCGNFGSVTGKDFAGGIIGINSITGTIRNCSNAAVVTGKTEVGGIVGVNSGTVQNCCNTGSVNGTYDVGGIVGDNEKTLQNCYNTGVVTASTGGGIAGLNNSATQNCYWLASSAAAGVNRTGGTQLNVIPFVVNTEDKYVLNTEVGGETLLLTVLNNGVESFQTNPASLDFWKESSNKPVLMIEPDIFLRTLPNGTVGAPYSAMLSATGDTPIIWDIISGSLPAGIYLSPTGEISGTPTQSGTFNFTVRASNEAGTDTKELSLIIKKQSVLSVTGIPTTVTYGDSSFTVGISGGGSGSVTFTIVNQEELNGETASGIAEITSNNDGTATVTILKAGKFQIFAAKAEDAEYNAGNAITSKISVDKKTVTITGISALDKIYDGNTNAVIAGLDKAEIVGNIDGENLKIDSTSAIASFENANTGSNKTVTFSGFTLSGPASVNYILSAQPANATAAINQVVTVSNNNPTNTGDNIKIMITILLLSFLTALVIIIIKILKKNSK